MSRKTNNKANIVRAINSLISHGHTDIKEVADLIGKDVRTVQYYMDMSNDREFKASEIQHLALHFSSVNLFGISNRFVPTTHEIVPLHIGRPTGDLKGVVQDLSVISARIYNCDAPDELKAIIVGMEKILANLKAEHALLASKDA